MTKLSKHDMDLRALRATGALLSAASTCLLAHGVASAHPPMTPSHWYEAYTLYKLHRPITSDFIATRLVEFSDTLDGNITGSRVAEVFGVRNRPKPGLAQGDFYGLFRDTEGRIIFTASGFAPDFGGHAYFNFDWYNADMPNINPDSPPIYCINLLDFEENIKKKNWKQIYLPPPRDGSQNYRPPITFVKSKNGIIAITVDKHDKCVLSISIGSNWIGQ